MAKTTSNKLDLKKPVTTVPAPITLPNEADPTPVITPTPTVTTPAVNPLQASLTAATDPLAEMVKMFRQGGGYGAGQNAILDTAASQAQAKAASDAVASDRGRWSSP